ncbi:MAG: hypothetical protein V9G19_22610 [Tetrasphaera sp.]
MAAEQGGVVHRGQLRTEGISRWEVRTEIASGRWARAGRHTICVGAREPSGAGLWWQAIWESGSGAALLDGASCLVASEMTGFEPDVIDISVPVKARTQEVSGVQLRRRRRLTPTRRGGVPRTEVEVAMIRAAQLATSDRQAALLLCLPVQQRLTTPVRLVAEWAHAAWCPRNPLLEQLIRDIADGAHSLGELDFAGLCRERDLPDPIRQQLVRGPKGRLYLDVEFACGLVVEIDGAQHCAGLQPLDDALRANTVSLRNRLVLRIPLVGLRLCPDAFLAQVAEAHRQRLAQPA